MRSYAKYHWIRHQQYVFRFSCRSQYGRGKIGEGGGKPRMITKPEQSTQFTTQKACGDILCIQNRGKLWFIGMTRLQFLDLNQKSRTRLALHTSTILVKKRNKRLFWKKENLKILSNKKDTKASTPLKCYVILVYIPYVHYASLL